MSGLNCILGKEEIDAHLLVLGPFFLGQKLVGGTALECAAESVDAVVGDLGREALEGFEDILVFLYDQVIESAKFQW